MRSREEWSAQWTASATWPGSVARPACSACWPSGTSTLPGSRCPRIGCVTSTRSTTSGRPASIAPTSSMKGRYARLLPAWPTQWPTAVHQPARVASATSCATIRDLPMPASPDSTTTPPRWAPATGRNPMASARRDRSASLLAAPSSPGAVRLGLLPGDPRHGATHDLERRVAADAATLRVAGLDLVLDGAEVEVLGGHGLSSAGADLDFSRFGR